jgi:hypothetical protein
VTAFCLHNVPMGNDPYGCLCCKLPVIITVGTRPVRIGTGLCNLCTTGDPDDD